MDEDSESLTARLRLESVGISVQVAPDETVVVIVDDDGKCDRKAVLAHNFKLCSLPASGVTIGLEEPSYTVDESGGTVEVCAILISGSLERTVDVTLFTMDGLASG